MNGYTEDLPTPGGGHWHRRTQERNDESAVILTQKVLLPDAETHETRKEMW